MSDLALFDILSPYFFAGINLGAGVEELLAVLHVDEIDACWDEDGVVLWGVARIDSDDPNDARFSPRAGGGSLVRDENDKPYATDQVFDLHDSSIRFRLTAARVPAGVLPDGDITSTSLRTLLTHFGSSTTPGSDYPGTQLRLELLCNLITVSIPGLFPAKLESNGKLVLDPSKSQVKLSLPRILLRIVQGGNGPDADFDISVASWGATALDGQSEEIASLLTMDPPYAFVGKDSVFGFGFRSLVLDLDDSQTPPQLRDNFGIGDDWQGVYLPEVRVFVAPNGLSGFAVSAAARELLIGIGDTSGVWGDFSLDVINQGSQLKATIRFVDSHGQALPNASSTDTGYRVTAGDGARMLIDITSGAAPYEIRAIYGRAADSAAPSDSEFDDGELLDPTQSHELYPSSVARQQIAVRITSQVPSQRQVILIEVHAAESAGTGAGASGGTGLRAIDNGTLSGGDELHRVTLTEPDPRTGTVRIQVTRPESATLEVGGEPRTLHGGITQVEVGEGQSVPISVNWSPGTVEQEIFHAYFPIENARNPGPGSDVALATTGPGGTGVRLSDPSSGWQSFCDRIPSGTAVRVDGFASYEEELEHAQPTFNELLADRRAEHLAQYLTTCADDPSLTITHDGHGSRYHPLEDGSLTAEEREQLTSADGYLNAAADSFANDGNYADDLRPNFWRATASYTRPAVVIPAVTGNITRGAGVPESTEDRDPAPNVNAPDFLRHLGATVRILQNEFIALEIRGQVDFHTGLESGLDTVRNQEVPPGADPAPNTSFPNPAELSNPSDGLTNFRLNISYDEANGTWTERLRVEADAADRDGLVTLGSLPPQGATEISTDFGRDVLGLYTVFMPLLAEAARPEPDEGDIVAVVVSLALPPILAALDIAHVLKFTIYGVEVAFMHHGDTDLKVVLLADVENSVHLNLALGDFVIVRSKPERPIKIRYKAVGFSINADFDETLPWQPVFDSSKGYTIDLADSGSLEILPSVPQLGELIQVLGARIARTNPLNLEVELGLGVDLGVFSVDKIGLRLPVDPLGPPSLTSLKISVDIPNTLVGSGALSVTETGFTGSLDLTLPSIKLRIAGRLGISNVSEGDREATAVFVSLIAELPAGIPLGGSGLGIFGFLGLFGMHYARNEPEGEDAALRWLTSVGGDPTNIDGWKPAIDNWAFGAGILLGTMEGAYVVRMTGMLVFEIPGPRLLFFVKASLLNTQPPAGVKNESGNLLAVLDINFGTGLIQLGIDVNYSLEPVLKLIIPVRGRFNTADPSDFALDIGTFAKPITAELFGAIKATAYLMMRGQGIEDFPLGQLDGFSIATGFHVSLTWGWPEINLYLRISAGFDAGIGFAPFFIAGQVMISGELHLFIISIEAHAALTAKSDGVDTWVHGEVCGSVDLFFFEVSGCVEFSVGVEPGTPFAPNLDRSLALQSRSPALIRGTGIDRGIDTVLCRGTTDLSVPTIEVRDETAPGPEPVYVEQEVYVPLDVIPLLQLEAPPELAAGFAIEGGLNGALPVVDGGYCKRGEVYVRYILDSVELSSPGLSTVELTTPGDRPNTWRPVRLGNGEGDVGNVDLALLDWIPNATPKAFEVSEELDQATQDAWGDVCEPVAAASWVLWDFHEQPWGPSPSGWRLEGEAWPDPAGYRRSRPVPTGMRVVETWRRGRTLDSLSAAIPARISGGYIPCLEGVEGTDEDAQIGEAQGDLPLSERQLGGVPQGELLFWITEPGGCPSKVLLPPFEWPATESPSSELAGHFAEYDSWRMYDELADVVRFELSPVHQFRVLVLLRYDIYDLYKGRAFNAAGAPVGVNMTILDYEGDVSPWDLPERWYLEGPWHEQVALIHGLLATVAEYGTWTVAMVEFSFSEPAAAIEFGIQPLADAFDNNLVYPAYAVLLAEGLSDSEVRRVTQDSQAAEAEADALADALNHDPANRALLLPGRRYDVTINYRAEVAERLDNGDFEVVRPTYTPATSPATYSFYTDAEAPRRLDPWILCQFPSPGEAYHFHDDPITLVFGTDDLTQLFGAYNRELRGRVRDASFRPPPEQPLLLANVQMLFDASVRESIPGVIFSPWEQSIRRLLGDNECRDFNPPSPRHERVVLDLHLEPRSEYIFDVEAPDIDTGELPPPPPSEIPGESGNPAKIRSPLYRQSLSTSRYASREAFAQDVRRSYVGSRALANPAPLLALAERCTDQELDAALQAAELGATPRPEHPQVTILWTTDPVPLPAIVLIETPEPLWRERLEPEAVREDDRVVAWTLVPKTWLAVEELVAEPSTPSTPGVWTPIDTLDYVRRDTGTRIVNAPTIIELRDFYLEPPPPPTPKPPPPAASLVERFIRDASGCRTLVVLRPEARGLTLSLGLIRNLNPLIDLDAADDPVPLLDVLTARAPWED